MTLAFIDEGRGEPVVLVHAFPLDGRVWDAVRAELSSTHRVIVPDLRGFGSSGGQSPPASVDAHADDLAAVLDELGVARAIVVGLSLGGYVALAFARWHLSRLAGLVLVDTRAAADTTEGRAGRDDAIARVRSHGSAAMADAMLPKMFPHGATPELESWFREIVSAQPVEGVVAALGAMRDRPDATPVLATVRVPSLVAVGSDDLVIPPAEAESMVSLLPDGAYVEFPGAGHLVPAEKPAVFTRALTSWLAHVARTRTAPSGTADATFLGAMLTEWTALRGNRGARDAIRALAGRLVAHRARLFAANAKLQADAPTDDDAAAIARIGANQSAVKDCTNALGEMVALLGHASIPA